MLLSIRQLADMTGFDRETVVRRLRSLAPQRVGKAKEFESRDALPILYAGEKAIAQDEKISLTEARTRESTAKAIGAEIDNETKLKQRIPLAVFQPTLDEWLGGIAAALKQARLPAPLLAELSASLRDVPKKLKW